MRTTYYDILGVGREPTKEELAKAYRKKATEFHPDKNIGKEAEATAKFKELTVAFETLSDPHKKFRYDRTIPKVKAKKPTKPIKPTHVPWAEHVAAHDPNMGKIWDSAPPSRDIWGNPLNPQEKLQWMSEQRQRIDTKPQARPKTSKPPQDTFIDVFAKDYESGSSPRIR